MKDAWQRATQLDKEKLEAIQAQDFERAASLRDQAYRHHRQTIPGVERYVRMVLAQAESADSSTIDRFTTRVGSSSTARSGE